MKKRLLLLFLCLHLALATTVFAQSDSIWDRRESCIFGMPQIGHAVKAHQKGLINDIFYAIFKPEDIDFEHQTMPYIRALEALETGKIDCTLAVRETRSGVHEGGVTMAIYDLSVAYLLKTGFNDLQSLAGTRVAFLHGFAIDRFVPVKFQAQQVYDLSSAFHMLDRDHAQYVLGDSQLLKDALRDSQLPTADIMIKPIKSFEIRPVFTASEKGKRLRDVYDRRMREMVARGTFQDIVLSHGLSEQGLKKLLDTIK